MKLTITLMQDTKIQSVKENPKRLNVTSDLTSQITSDVRSQGFPFKVQSSLS